jgi:hypothetical protein
MDRDRTAPAEDALVLDINHTQMVHFQQADPRCRALQLPEGVMLRYTLSQALYFYLRTGIVEGRITTRVFASDSPYDRCKADVGQVLTPMFEAAADRVHLEKLERLLRGWVDFVKDEVGPEEGDFKSFPVGPQDN